MNAAKKQPPPGADRTIHLRVSAYELAEIKRRALAADMSVSAYLRFCALDCVDTKLGLR